MSEGQLMEALIAGGAVVVVVGAIASILFKVTIGNSESRRLDKLKRELDKK
jgi:hypothetical protein